MNCHGVAKIGQIGEREFCHTAAMTTRTIPEYLEEEGQEAIDNQPRTEEEAARIQPLQHGHHGTAKQPRTGIAASSQSRNQEKKKQKNRRGSSQETTRHGKDGSENPQEGLIRL
jgi:hypothetical protein